MVPKVNLAPSPVSLAFPHIQWDPLGSLRLTAQESALLRMAETNPIEYTLADSRDASMYARVLLKLLAEAVAAGAGTGEVSRVSEMCTEEQALDALDRDPLGVATHYAITKLYDILNMLISGTGVTISSVFYVGKEGILVDQWKALLRMLNKSAKGDVWAQSGASLCLALILLTACPSQKNAFTKDEKGQTVKRISRPTSYASAVEPLEALTAWIVSQLKMSSSSSCVGYSVAVAIPAMTALMNCTESRLLFAASGGIKFLARHLRLGGKRQAQNKDKKKDHNSCLRSCRNLVSATALRTDILPLVYDL